MLFKCAGCGVDTLFTLAYVKYTIILRLSSYKRLILHNFLPRIHDIHFICQCHIKALPQLNISSFGIHQEGTRKSIDGEIYIILDLSSQNNSI